MDSSKFPKNQFTAFGSLVSSDSVVKKYDIQPISNLNRVAYSKIKESFDPELSLGDKHFRISDLVQSQLSVETEELKRFQSAVDIKVKLKLDELKEICAKEGFEQGLAEGTRKAYSESKAALDEKIEALTSAHLDIEMIKTNLSKNYDTELTSLAMKLASILVHHELESAPELVHHVVHAILDRMAKSEDVVVRISKSYADCLDLIKEKLHSNSGAERKIQFELDSNLKRGDVIVESISGEISSYVNNKIIELEKLLMENIERKHK